MKGGCEGALAHGHGGDKRHLVETTESNSGVGEGLVRRKCGEEQTGATTGEWAMRAVFLIPFGTKGTLVPFAIDV